MFYSSEPEALRAFIRDKLRFPHTDVGYGRVTHFTMPGGVQVQLYQPYYSKASRR